MTTDQERQQEHVLNSETSSTDSPTVDMTASSDDLNNTADQADILGLDEAAANMQIDTQDNAQDDNQDAEASTATPDESEEVAKSKEQIAGVVEKSEPLRRRLERAPSRKRDLSAAMAYFKWLWTAQARKRIEQANTKLSDVVDVNAVRSLMELKDHIAESLEKDAKVRMRKLRYDVGMVGEDALRLLLQLDAVSTHGIEEIRSLRKQAVSTINGIIDSAEKWKTRIGALNSKWEQRLEHVHSQLVSAVQDVQHLLPAEPEPAAQAATASPMEEEEVEIAKVNSGVGPDTNAEAPRSEEPDDQVTQADNDSELPEEHLEDSVFAKVRKAYPSMRLRSPLEYDRLRDGSLVLHCRLPRGMRPTLENTRVSADPDSRVLSVEANCTSLRRRPQSMYGLYGLYNSAADTEEVLDGWILEEVQVPDDMAVTKLKTSFDPRTSSLRIQVPVKRIRRKPPIRQTPSYYDTPSSLLGGFGGLGGYAPRASPFLWA